MSNPRNTPTGVGTTKTEDSKKWKGGKHPHGRGDDLFAPWLFLRLTETPPRAWGRLYRWVLQQGDSGNTPTGVGTTKAMRAYEMDVEKHPHGRGDDGRSWGPLASRLETPPRAWGRPPETVEPGQVLGNTPTGVGTTWRLQGVWIHRRKHPHGRGDDPQWVRRCGM